MAQYGKWIDGIAPDSTVAEAARQSLKARLASTERFLPLAALQPEKDVEHVHRLRVSTRRAVAALRLFDNLLPSRTAAWLKKKLKRMRKAAGDARDLDVLLARLHCQGREEDSPVCDLIVERREAAQPPIREVYERCWHNHRFHNNVRKLLDRVRTRGKNRKPFKRARFADWASEQLHDVAEQFFAALPINTSDYAALHQFRIRAKRLRYTMELVSPAFDPDFREELYPMVEQVQDRLGAINDHVTAAATFRQWIQSADDPRVHERLERLAEEEDQTRAQGLSEFNLWWTPAYFEDLRAALLNCWTTAGAG